MSIIRQRTKHLIYSGLIGALTTGLLASGGFVYTAFQHRNKLAELEYRYQADLSEAKSSAAKTERRKVVVLTRDIEAGTRLGDEDIKYLEMNAADAPQGTDLDLRQVAGRTFKLAGVKNTPVLSSMLYEEGVLPKDVRQEEFSVIRLPSLLKKDDFVDVRISFPTGQDYIVLAKKRVDNVSEDTVWLKLGEKEILDMSSAVVDAYLHGAKLYSLPYVDPQMQDKAEPTYPVNAKVLELIRTDPNVLETAKLELMRSMRHLLDKDLQNMDEASKQKITAGIGSGRTEDNLTGIGPVQREEPPSVAGPTIRPPVKPEAGAEPGGFSAGLTGSSGKNPAVSAGPETPPSEIRERQEDIFREAVQP
ncbi:SAF domain-containing protein [Paenibacillus sp. UNC499MF]|uniref:SAF domain-containing protein n=1 Tax=Paenibacillus sp. UNC499MF TaxID=1502751 RepID=UPI00089FB6DF|nr:SAF domain-containing protein [Paenibacillus sp. UNC499MF]SEF53635.1 SAF domain-containing protein [Paenibacillus sp. UNC499MF]